MNLQNNSRLFTLEEITKVVSKSSRSCITEYVLPNASLSAINDKFSGYQADDRSYWQSVFEASGRELQAELDYCERLDLYLHDNGLGRSKGYIVLNEYKIYLRTLLWEQANSRLEEVRQRLAYADSNSLPNDMASSPRFRILLLRLTNSEAEYKEMVVMGKWEKPERQMRNQHTAYFGPKKKVSTAKIIKNVEELLPYLSSKALKKARHFIETEQWKDQEFSA